MRKNFKKLLTCVLSVSLAICQLSVEPKQICAATTSSSAARYEFEDGEMTGETTAQISEDGVGYAYLQDAGTNDSVTVNVTVEESGIYDLTISYMLPKVMGDAKTQYILVNGKSAGTINFTSCEEWRDLNIGSYALKAGENTITVKAFWGWMYLDALSVEKASLPPLVGNNTLSDSQATDSAQGLMNYLADNYGKHVLTGQQETYGQADEGEFEYIASVTGGKAPAIRGFDYMNNNPLFGWDDGTTDRIINWVNTRGGIATTSYHWFAPADMSTYELGKEVPWSESAFYVNGANSVTTNFDVSKVSDETSLEYQYIMLSLDGLAKELKKLQDADIPIIFRPLHEAGGSGTSDCSGEWFWWANKGPEAYKYLWKLVYKTLTETYGLHNLIWEFNSYTYENSYDWYPGDEYVDIIAYDKYNADNSGPNESAISSTYYSLVKMYSGKKMVSMAECDTIPSVENISEESAYWLYACPWYGDFIESAAKNAPETLNTIYNSDLFITLDELPEYKTYEYNPEINPTVTESTTMQTTSSETTANNTVSQTSSGETSSEQTSSNETTSQQLTSAENTSEQTSFAENTSEQTSFVENTSEETSSDAQPTLPIVPSDKYEFEDGVMTGNTTPQIYKDGVGYAYLQDAGTNDSVSVTVNVSESGIYDLSISYLLLKEMGDAKTQYILVNNKSAGTINFTACDTWRTIDIGSYALKAGENIITVKAFWGWMYLDSLSVEKSSLPPLAGNNTLSDKKANISTQGLMNYLSDMYGNHVLTGQQEIYGQADEGEFEYIASVTGGKAPAIRGFDYMNNNPLFGWDDGTTDRIINWVNTKGGIATVCYHWFAPADMSTYELGKEVPYSQSAFYVNGANSVTTNFDVSKVSDETSLEYQYIMLSLEGLAKELKKLQDADIPIIFRPLHEAGGSGTSDCSGEWFWWANKGPEAYKYLWKLVYNTLTETYGLHNLIWEFNSYTYENSYDWYPGDEYVDIIAYDKYNADSNGPNESAISSTYYSLLKMYSGKKMIAMAECDTIPSVQNILDESAYWLYACPWYGEYIESTSKNAAETLNTIYNSDLFITLDELPSYKTYKTNSEEQTTIIETTTQQPTGEVNTSEQSTTATATTEVVTTSESATESTAPDPTTEPETTSEDPTEPTAPDPTTEPETTSEDPTEPTAPDPTTEPETTSEDPTEPTAPDPTTEPETTSEDSTESTTEAETTSEDSTEPISEQPTQQETSSETSTEQSTTIAQSTVSETTSQQATEQSTTQESTTQLITEQPTTQVVATEPVTEQTSTAEPTTQPVTEQTTAVEPTTEPVTEQTTTAAPTTQPITEQTTTAEPTTQPVTEQTTAAEPTTEPVTEQTATAEPTTQPVTEQTTAAEPTTQPVTEQTTAAEPTTQPVTEQTTAAEPTTQPVTEQATATEPTTQSANNSPQVSRVDLSATTYIYNGKVKTPTVKVTDTNGNILINSRDYTVSYPAGRKNVGKYTITVTFFGNYHGIVKTSFTILPKGTKISTLKGAKRSLKITFKRQTSQINGYQISYSTSKKFKASKSKLLKKKNTKNATLKNLSSKKRYYVRIRTYKNVKINGKTVRLYSKWSTIKSVRTK